MASGMGVNGVEGRCYGFYSDFRQCQTEIRQAVKKYDPSKVDPEDAPKLESCWPYREDYFECLHGRKHKAREAAIQKEAERQAYEARHGPAPTHGGH